MSVTKHRLRRAAAVALVATVALGVAVACGDDEPAPGGKPEKLVVDTFGEFGYDDLVKQYEAETGIKVELRKTAQLGDYTPQAGPLTRHRQGRRRRRRARGGHHQPSSRSTRPTGSTCSTYVGDLERRVPGVEVRSWARRRTASSSACRPTSAPSRSATAVTCSPRPGCRPTARRFRRCGRRGTSSSRPRRPTGRPPARAARLGDHARCPPSWCRSAASTSTTTTTASTSSGADKENLVAANSPAVKQAWDTGQELVDGNATAKAATWSPEWTAGFKNGTFAATLCPSWMTGIVEDNSGPENKGKWDVAAVPGGGGNWGGSWLAVPTQSKYPEEAAKLAQFLTNAAGPGRGVQGQGPAADEPRGAARPRLPGVHQPVLQQRADRQDLRRERQAIKPVTSARSTLRSRSRRWSRPSRLYEQGQLTPSRRGSSS